MRDSVPTPKPLGLVKGKVGAATGILVLVLGLLLSACARLPDLRALKTSLKAPAAPTVVDGKGPLTGRDAKTALAQRLGHTQMDAKVLAALEEVATGQPLIAGNKVTLLFDGPRTIAAMRAAVEGARDTIHLETYLFDEDTLGQEFADLLIAKQKEGVQVNIIYDCVGTLGTPQAFYDRMEEAGIRLLPFNPVTHVHRLWRWRLNNRDHRKILVVDGRVAFAGGVNITAAYARGSVFRSKTRKSKALGWRDTHLQIEGPAVASLQWLFLDTWAREQKELLPNRGYFPSLLPAGDKVVRVVGSRPGGDLEIYKAYFLAIQSATKSIHITSAYFVPDVQILRALTEAARRGVEVKLVLPSVSDSGPVFHAGHSFYTGMLKAGIRIFEMRTSILHAKTAVIDGSWSTVGSTNLDTRSFLHNQEVNIIVLGDAFGQEMETAFTDDLKESTEITLPTWRQRPLLEQVKERLARLIAYWL